MNHTSDEGREMIRVSQKIRFDASGFRMLTLQPPDMDRRVLFGTKFTDGLHTLYFIFSQTATSRTVSVIAENPTIAMPVELGKWAWIPVDASYEWSLQGWPLPRTWDFRYYSKPGPKEFSTAT